MEKRIEKMKAAIRSGKRIVDTVESFLSEMPFDPGEACPDVIKAIEDFKQVEWEANQAYYGDEHESK